ncbi:MAG: PorP/SprF family type IX secretion system membrane protein [Saprospiraceae bacterium]|nr:PorP/SprF family type IX secretion system membrane protein [Saprospiraceae bacterium]
MRLRTFILVVLLLPPVLACTQDLHYSQFYHQPLHLNPAQTGVFRGDLRAAALYRSQWSSVPVSYRSYAVSADRKMLDVGANILSLGILLQHDKAGDAGMRWTQMGLSAGVARSLSEQHSVSAGVGLAFAQRAFDISALTFKNQWSAGDYMFDPNLPTKEGFNQSSGMRSSLSAGMNWHFEQPDKRTEANAGLGAFHLNRPNVGFDQNTAEPLPMRLAFFANTAVELNEFFDLVVFAQVQRMGTAQEIVAGGGPRFWLVPEVSAVQLSIATRVGDALIPALQYQRGNWTFGLSYDWNTSGFEAATNGRGGLELAVVYRSMPVPPAKSLKSCPIF